MIDVTPEPYTPSSPSKIMNLLAMRLSKKLANDDVEERSLGEILDEMEEESDGSDNSNNS